MKAAAGSERPNGDLGRRGVAGNFFVMKAVGAAAEEGADLDEIVRIGEKVNSVTRTMGMAL
ncbi:MAG TPA: dihydroxyacetone kinase subunit DhaK, partial [Nakamurella sp.]